MEAGARLDFTTLRQHTFLKKTKVRLVTSNFLFNMVIMATERHLI